MYVNAPNAWGTRLYIETTSRMYRHNHLNGSVYYANYSAVVDKSRTPLRSGAFIDGWRYPTPHYATVSRCENVSGSHWWSLSFDERWTYQNGDTVAFRDLSLSTPSVANALSNLTDAAGTGALDKLNGTHIEAGIALLEAGKTFGHLASTAARLFGLLRAMKKGRFGEAADILGLNLSRRGTLGLARNWLEYQYAWRPLLMDVTAAYDIAQQGIDVPLTISGVRDVKQAVDVTLTSNQPWDGTGIRQFQMKNLTVSATVGVKACIHAKVKSAELTRLKAFGLVNPASIAWELLPWSFLIDWALPVGEFLNACTAKFGLEFVSGTYSKYVHLDSTHTDMGVLATDYYVPKGYTEGSVRVQKLVMSRSVMTDFPTPVLYGRTSLATNKLVTAAALWRTLRR
jgi:hypothetical protein